MAWVRSRLCKLQKGCTRLAAAGDKVYQLLVHGRWFSPGTPASSTTKTGRHDIGEILLKVALNTKNQSIYWLYYKCKWNFNKCNTSNLKLFKFRTLHRRTNRDYLGRNKSVTFINCIIGLLLYRIDKEYVLIFLFIYIQKKCTFNHDY
jgi:hypothetical protein